MKNILITSVLALGCGIAFAKLPTPVLDDAAKLKAAETAARAAWQTKVDNYQLCKAQDRVVAHYAKNAGKAVAVPAKDAKAVATTAPAAKPVSPAPATAAAAAVAAAPSAAPSGAAAPTGTPAVAAAPTPCSDPGPFAFTPPEQKPLEASGAHSPPGTAGSPPSVNKPAAEMAPAKKS